jgi:dTDP-glucose pyrophosphorylase
LDRALLITANGDGTRMKRFFGLPKHSIFYQGKRIHELISQRGSSAGFAVYIAVQNNYEIQTKDAGVIVCGPTQNRMETIHACLPYLERYESILVHDCDVLFEEDMLASMQDDAISVSFYRKDGKKYGFVDIDENFSYLVGNEKQREAPFITTGLYSFSRRRMELFYEHYNKPIETMLDYYNLHRPRLLFAQDYINLGDIQSYMQNL